MFTASQQALQEKGTVRAEFKSFSVVFSSVALDFERLCEAHFEHCGQFYATLCEVGEKVEATGPDMKVR